MRGMIQAKPNAGQPTPTYSTGGGGRKKGVCVRPWLVLYSSGDEPKLIGKHDIMRRTGLPARDLRILDPLLSYPSSVLGREKAIVVNLEHIKTIITPQEVFLLNSGDPLVSPFKYELQRRILCHHHVSKPQEEENSEGEAHIYTRIDPSQGEAGTPQLFGNQGSDVAKKDAKQSLENQDGSKVLPFEFVALEVCLESASSSLEQEALRLELEAHLALDKLTSKISTFNLEQVLQIKTRLVNITGRVQKVRDELEHLLDNDENMAQMYLTEKLAQEVENSDLLEGDEEDRHANRDESYLKANDAHDLLTSELNGNSRGTHASPTRSAMSYKFNIKELEMLLEPYFVQIDGTLNKLSTLKEHVDDTEDYIKIKQDGEQNRLLQSNVKATTATLLLNAFIVVAGVFGMNISIELFKDEKNGPMIFLCISLGSIFGWLFLYAVIIRWFKLLLI
ncbi:hypothetical protein EUTSA_v10027315mg [Eutrema salsugineum]|uniref:Magnesium transporter n=1 Tax=Eutrema salsugineum TaxID=72664 RepID=V4P1L0_EUTSA|nr:hypothetical protein EUTSA_v10027315mg [Eutrema salsugineum]